MSSREPRWVPRLVVDAVYSDQMREHGGLVGLRDENALESALARPRQRWAYMPDATMARLASDYAFAITKNHPFRDGNKRMSLLTAIIFLEMNGCRFEASEEAAYRIALALAAGDLKEEGLTAWFEDVIDS